jgi:hypothetical protein
MPWHPHAGYLILVCQRTESIQAFCNQSRSHFWAAKRLKSCLAIRKNMDPLMSISPSYVFTCTLENSIYFGLKNRGIFTQRETEASLWSFVINTRPCLLVNPRSISKPDYSVIRKHWIFVFPILLVNYDHKGFSVMVSWYYVVRKHTLALWRKEDSVLYVFHQKQRNTNQAEVSRMQCAGPCFKLYHTKLHFWRLTFNRKSTAHPHK